MIFVPEWSSYRINGSVSLVVFAPDQIRMPHSPDNTRLRFSIRNKARFQFTWYQNEILYQNENLIRTENREPIVEWLVWERNVNKYRERYRAFSLTWPASMQIYGNKRKCLHKKRVQLPQDWFGKPTWPPFYCFGTPIWPPWRHVKTLYQEMEWTCSRMKGGIPVSCKLAPYRLRYASCHVS